MRPYFSEYLSRDPGDGNALARQRHSHRSLAGVYRPRPEAADANMGRHDPGRLRKYSRFALARHRTESRGPDRRLRRQSSRRRSARRHRSEIEERDVSGGEPILSVRDLSVSFRTDGVWRPAVEALSFDVGPRETVALVGESGSGKSVTALPVMRLLPPANSKAEGIIRLDGRDVLKLPEGEMRGLRGAAASMIFQEPMTSLNPVLTIGFQIAEALINHRSIDRKTAEAEALRILERVRVPAARQRLHDYPHRFSGGMRQRVMIAMALACRPKLLIADEPTTALDVTVQADILELIKSLQDRDGMSVLFITHDMGVVAEIADRVVVMWKGKKVEEGTAAETLTRPRHSYTQALIAAVPRLGSMKGEPSPKPFPEPESAAALLDPIRDSNDRGGLAVRAEQRPLLEVANLVTRFPVRSGIFGRESGRVHAVENVSFSLRAGETLALVGESGCGKSTTGRSILRLVEPSEGRVLFEGQDVRTLDSESLRKVRQRIQMVFQDPFASLNPRKSAGEAIAEPIIVHGLARPREARDRVADLLHKVGLTPDMATRLPHEFSGGQRLSVGMLRPCQHLRRGALLDLASLPHHHDAVGDLGDDAHVMGDEENRHPISILQGLDQFEDVGLDRHVERGGRLIGDEQLRSASERNGDHDALSHAAGKSMRIVVKSLTCGRNAHAFENAQRLRLGRLAIDRSVIDQRFCDLKSDSENRIEARHRLLEDHGGGSAAKAAHLPLRELEHVTAVEANNSFGLFYQEKSCHYRIARAMKTGWIIGRRRGGPSRGRRSRRMADPIAQIAHTVRRIEICDREIGHLNATSTPRFGYIRPVLSGAAPAISALLADAI